MVFSLSVFVAGVDVYPLHCPVLALRIFLDRTASGQYRPCRRFVSLSYRSGALGPRGSSEFLCSTSPELISSSVRGQFHCDSLSQESRGHSVSAVEYDSAADFVLGGVSSGDLSSSVYHGSPRRSGGPSRLRYFRS